MSESSSFWIVLKKKDWDNLECSNIGKYMWKQRRFLYRVRHEKDIFICFMDIIYQYIKVALILYFAMWSTMREDFDA